MNKNKYSESVSVAKTDLWQRINPLLRSLDLVLTERCNNNCIHCCINLPENDEEARRRELSAVELKTILEEAAGLGCLMVRMTGGEPLIRDDFEELYLHARKLGMKILLATNATRINDHFADLFSNIPPLVPIQVTLYGITKKSYESVSRLPGSFNQAMNGINLLLEKDVPFLIRGVLLPTTRDEINGYKELVNKIPRMEEKDLVFTELLDKRCRCDSDKINRRIEKLRIPPEELINLTLENQENYVENTREFCSKFAGPPGEKLFACGAGSASGAIDPYGYFHPCSLLLTEKTAYDLKSGSIKDALDNFFPSLRKESAENPEYLERCARCFLKGLCEQCPARSWSEHGTLDTPIEYHCSIAHARARTLGLIRKGEKGWEVSDWKQRLDSAGKEKDQKRG